MTIKPSVYLLLKSLYMYIYYQGVFPKNSELMMDIAVGYGHQFNRKVSSTSSHSITNGRKKANSAPRKESIGIVDEIEKINTLIALIDSRNFENRKANEESVSPSPSNANILSKDYDAIWNGPESSMARTSEQPRSEFLKRNCPTSEIEIERISSHNTYDPSQKSIYLPNIGELNHPFQAKIEVWNKYSGEKCMRNQKIPARDARRATRLKPKAQAQIHDELCRIQYLANLFAQRFRVLHGQEARKARPINPSCSRVSSPISHNTYETANESIEPTPSPQPGPRRASSPSIASQLEEIARVESAAQGPDRKDPASAPPDPSTATTTDASNHPWSPSPPAIHGDGPGGDALAADKPSQLSGSSEPDPAGAPCGGPADFPEGGASPADETQDASAQRMPRVTFAAEPSVATVRGPSATPRAGSRCGRLAQRSYEWASSWVERLPKGGRGSTRPPRAGGGGGGCFTAVVCAVRRGVVCGQ